MLYMYSVWGGSALPLISWQLMISRLTHFQHDPEGTVQYGLPLLDNPKCEGTGCLRVVYLQYWTVGIEWLVLKMWCWCLRIRECLPPKLSKDCWLVAIWLLLFQSERGGIFIFVLFIITFKKSSLIIFVIKIIMIILVLICKSKLTTRRRRRKVTVITVLRRQDRQRARCNDQCAKNEIIIIVVILPAMVLKEYLHSSFCWIRGTKSFCWFRQYSRFVS